jgi:hypothetical protein
MPRAVMILNQILSGLLNHALERCLIDITLAKISVGNVSCSLKEPFLAPLRTLALFPFNTAEIAELSST